MVALTAKQREANRLLAGPARNIMLRGGSRSGKTFILVRAIGEAFIARDVPDGDVLAFLEEDRNNP